MKYYLALIIIYSACSGTAKTGRAVEFAMEEMQQVSLWESKILSSAKYEPEEKIEALWLGLRNMGWRRSLPNHSLDVDGIYFELQKNLISTPGHARYLTSRLADARKETDKPWMDGSYILQFDIIRQTLIHLPSPETVWETGKLLEDPTDLITHEIILERKAMKDPTFVEWRFDANPRNLATYVFNQIGLRSDGDAPMRAAARLQWWAEVKSGQRTFSFKGQNVEYRFKPDGTWETIPIANPPDDGPRPMVAEPAAPVAREASSQPDAPADRDTPTHWRWVWLSIAVVLISGYFGFRMFRKEES